jgi:hypothetical protein
MPCQTPTVNSTSPEGARADREQRPVQDQREDAAQHAEHQQQPREQQVRDRESITGKDVLRHVHAGDVRPRQLHLRVGLRHTRGDDQRADEHAAANAGGIDTILAGRPGSWEVTVRAAVLGGSCNQKSRNPTRAQRQKIRPNLI